MRAGRPRFEPTDAQREVAEALLRCGVPIEQARTCIINPETRKPISYHTFCRVFGNEIATAVVLANAMVARNLYLIATANKASAATVQACIFWLRTKGGWRYAEGSAPELPEHTDGMVETEEAAQRFIDNALARYGRTIGHPPGSMH
ncbi:hypothetical protein [Paraburkholderia ferrariae]|uniref:Uncharacterized protein n=1 Tax=Paraburkholderia ferrariae TaxID=386056 RepID=A0ABU9RYG6_9BURK